MNPGYEFVIQELVLEPNIPQAIEEAGDFAVLLGLENFQYNQQNLFLSDRIWIHPNSNSFDPAYRQAYPFLSPGDELRTMPFDRLSIALRGFPHPQSSPNNNTSPVTVLLGIGKKSNLVLTGQSGSQATGTPGSNPSNISLPFNPIAPNSSALAAGSALVLPSKNWGTENLNSGTAQLPPVMEYKFALNATTADAESSAVDQILAVKSAAFATDLVSPSAITPANLISVASLIPTDKLKTAQLVFNLKSATGGSPNIGLYSVYVDADSGDLIFFPLQMQDAATVNGGANGTGVYVMPEVNGSADYIAVACNFNGSTAFYVTGTVKVTM